MCCTAEVTWNFYLKAESTYSAALLDELVFWRHWRQNGAMPSVQIKDVPEDTHRVLRERAARAHQSLQEYLRSRLIAEASQPTVEEVLARVSSRKGGSLPFHSAADGVRAERDSR